MDEPTPIRIDVRISDGEIDRVMREKPVRVD
jgi:hypothetical protein